MNKKSLIRYLVYLVLIFTMIYLRDYVGGLANEHFKREFRIDFYLVAISMLITIGIGLVLGLEHFINERSKEGTWKINYTKIIILGLPSLYFSLTYFLAYSNNEYLQNIIAFTFLKLMIHGSGYVSLFQLILGYVIITSFYKGNDKVES